jgi:hypothetical protein
MFLISVPNFTSLDTLTRKMSSSLVPGKIYIPKCEQRAWRIGNNLELQNILTEIKMRRLEWLGHALRGKKKTTHQSKHKEQLTSMLLFYIPQKNITSQHLHVFHNFGPQI